MSSETICAVIVTYNRKKLLLECLEALENQSRTVDAIYIVDNASTDGTPELLVENGYIKELPSTELKESLETNIKNDLMIHYLKMPENTGGAGGFYEGVKKAYKKGYDWLWLMDDDTIANSDALEVLYSKTDVSNKVGFLCSKVLWEDGNIHFMNIPQIQPIINGEPFNNKENEDVLLVKGASFVSLLLKNKTVKEVGFPIKDFFIWGDDLEYTERITNKGFHGLYVKESTVYHKTQDNYCVNITSDKRENSWKYFFGIRNTLYVTRKKNYPKFLVNVIYNLSCLNIKILKNRPDNRLEYIWINTKATISSIFFNPI